MSISGPCPAHPEHYLVCTPRGNILTRYIVHTTNAHAAHLLPGLRGLVFPVRGHMSAQQPTAPLDTLARSYTFLWAEGFDYLTQLHPGGTVLLGGGLFQSGAMGFGEIGERDDSGVSVFASAHIAGILGVVTGRPGDVRVDCVWTGTMGYTPDGMPWVGAVPERLAGGRTRPRAGGEWVAAGFCGEGMVNAWLCGEAVGRMVCGEGDTGLPRPMLLTEERVQSADLMDLAREAFGQLG